MGAARAVPVGQLPLPPALPAAAVTLLDQARRGLAEAAAATDPRERYATAHLGALRAAAETGSSRAVTEREADDLVRDADRFLALVEESLGLTRHVPVPEHLAYLPGRSLA